MKELRELKIVQVRENLICESVARNMALLHFCWTNRVDNSAKLSDPIRVGIRIWTRRNSDTLGGITLAFLLTFPIAFAFYKSLHFRPVFRPEFRPAIGRKWCQFRLVQTRIPAQKTHQLLLDSAKGRKGCKIPSSSDTDSEVDSDPKDAPIIKRT